MGESALVSNGAQRKERFGDEKGTSAGARVIDSGRRGGTSTAGRAVDVAEVT
jgi:hypothetical protein